MWSKSFVIILSLFCVVILQEVKLSTSADNTEKTLSPKEQKNRPKIAESYKVEKFNGTLLVEFEDHKRVSPVEVGRDTDDMIVRVGDEKRVRFNISSEPSGRSNSKTAWVSLKRYNGNVVLRAGDLEVKLKSISKKKPHPHHVGLTYL